CDGGIGLKRRGDIFNYDTSEYVQRVGQQNFLRTSWVEVNYANKNYNNYNHYVVAGNYWVSDNY
ncbi:MAG: hypothetical protein RMX57_06800, partial [Planktomarina sp.]|nr:hypothetical protein [Planktomarina sp.]